MLIALIHAGLEPKQYSKGCLVSISSAEHPKGSAFNKVLQILSSLSDREVTSKDQT